MIFEERIARWAKLKQPDRAAIQKLETFLDTEFYEKSKLGGYTRAYTKNKQGRITGIAISAIEAESSITSFHHFKKNILRNTISILKEFNQLSALNFYDNQISDVTPFKELKQLKKLGLRGNQINDIAPLRELRQLTKLELDNNNQISNITHLRELKHLIWLNLCKNQINDISPLTELKQLMLRSLEKLQFIIGTFQSFEIYFGTQGKMVKMMLNFQAFQFENSI